MKHLSIKTRFWQIILQSWSLWLALMLMIGLLWRNPFSDRTLIPNFEPYPDPFHYLTPARCFLQGRGWKLCRPNSVGIKPAVSPLYSISFLPVLALNNDPRMFYVINVLLSLSSVILLYQILRKISASWMVQLLPLLLYVTSYHLYWFPSLVMAENLIMPLYLLFTLLLISQVTWCRTLTTALILICFYGAKYAYLPLAGVGGLLYSLKIFSIGGLARTKRFSPFGLLLLMTGMGLMIMGGANIINQLRPLQTIGQKYLAAYIPVTQPVAPAVSQKQAWFAQDYLLTNLEFYGRAIIGQPTRVLWDYRSFYPIWVSAAGILGLIISLFQKKLRLLSISLLGMISGQVLFMAFFYTADGRYVFHLLPSMLIGLGIYLSFVERLFTKLNQRLFVILLTIWVLAIYGLTNFSRLKSQLAVNFKYAETPWAYLAVQDYNRFFASPELTDQPSPKYLITLLPPFYLDFFKSGSYQVLPLSNVQDFKNQREQVWGEPQTEELFDLYRRKMNEGAEVFVTNYFINSSDQFRRDFATIEQSFELEKVQTGCFEGCNLYRLDNK